MSRSKRYIIRCDGHKGEDGCRDGSLFDGYEGKKEAEQRAVQVGWLIGQGRARELCPECAAREADPIVSQAGFRVLKILASMGDVRVGAGGIPGNVYAKLVRQEFAMRVGEQPDEFTFDYRPYRITDAGRAALVEAAGYWG